MTETGRPKKSLNPNGTIQCKTCLINKYPESFSQDKRSALGFQVSCKSCEKEYRQTNKLRIQNLRNENEKYLTKQREYYLNHKEQINHYKRQRYSTEEGRLKVLAVNHARRAKKISTSDGTVTYMAIKKLLLTQDYRCAISGKPLDSYHIDHIIPLAKGGKHIINNIQLVLPEINMSKKDSLNYGYR